MKKTSIVIIKVIFNAILVVLLLVGFSVAFTMLPIKNNIKLLTVMSGSMEPTIGVGSVVVVRPSQEYKVGDVITYISHGAKDSNDTTTHRIYEIKQQDGVKTYITKGDFNETPDMRPVDKEKISGKVVLKVPYIGYLLGYIKTLPGLVLLIIVPATIIIYEEVRKLKAEAKKIIERRRVKGKEGNIAPTQKVTKKKSVSRAEKARPNNVI